jgi:SOS-response transcriptional repressor LexA
VTDDLGNEPEFTPLQGQYLAFIATYTVLNGRPPAESDMQRFFRVTPPAVHNMILMLERRRLIRRTPGRARSIQVLVPRDKLPLLADAREARNSEGYQDPRGQDEPH